MPRKKRVKNATPRKRVAKQKQKREPYPVIVVAPERCMYCDAPGSMRTYKTKPSATFISRYKECRKCGHRVNEIEDRTK